MGKEQTSIYSAGKTGYPHTKEQNWTHTLHYKQKLTINGLKTYIKGAPG